MHWIISIGALGLVYYKYGAQYSALAALPYFFYRVADCIGLIGAAPAISNCNISDQNFIAFLSGSVHRYIWQPHDVAVIS